MSQTIRNDLIMVMKSPAEVIIKTLLKQLRNKSTAMFLLVNVLGLIFLGCMGICSYIKVDYFFAVLVSTVLCGHYTAQMKRLIPGITTIPINNLALAGITWGLGVGIAAIYFVVSLLLLAFIGNVFPHDLIYYLVLVIFLSGVVCNSPGLYWGFLNWLVLNVVLLFYINGIIFSIVSLLLVIPLTFGLHYYSLISRRQGEGIKVSNLLSKYRLLPENILFRNMVVNKTGLYLGKHLPPICYLLRLHSYAFMKSILRYILLFLILMLFLSFNPKSFEIIIIVLIPLFFPFILGEYQSWHKGHYRSNELLLPITEIEISWAEQQLVWLVFLLFWGMILILGNSLYYRIEHHLMGAYIYKHWPVNDHYELLKQYQYFYLKPGGHYWMELAVFNISITLYWPDIWERTVLNRFIDYLLMFVFIGGTLVGITLICRYPSNNEYWIAAVMELVLCLGLRIGIYFINRKAHEYGLSLVQPMKKRIMTGVLIYLGIILLIGFNMHSLPEWILIASIDLFILLTLIAAWFSHPILIHKERHQE